MNYESSPITIAIFAILVGVVLALSFYLGRKAKSAKGYYAAHGQVHWFVNGVAFAGDYLSHLVGWQEGAVLSAHHAVERIAKQLHT